MIRRFFIFLCFICITSCSRLNFTQGEILFSNSDKHFELGSRLVLKESGTFIYEDQISSMIFKAEGYWKKIGNTIELNSSNKVKIGIIEAKERVTSKDNLQIKIVDVENIPITGTIIFLNNNFEDVGYADEDGLSLFKKKEVDSIRVNYFGFDCYHKVRDQKANFFELKIRPNDKTKIYFDKERWILKGRKLITSKDVVLKSSRW